MTNDGWSFVALTEDELAGADEETAIRGFKLEKKAQKVTPQYDYRLPAVAASNEASCRRCDC